MDDNRELIVELGGTFALEMEKEAVARGLTIDEVASECLIRGAEDAFGLTNDGAEVRCIYSGD